MNGYNVKIITDSKSSTTGDRLTTFELTYPRFIHSELLTHRLFSRNSASSRAIPIEKLITRVEECPVMPVFWGKNQKGMQAAEEISEEVRSAAETLWLDARDEAIQYANNLLSMGLHKQLVNRILEPWMFITTIVTATEFENFFALRTDKAAQPEFQYLASEMKTAYENNKPNHLRDGEWHLPYVELTNATSPLFVPEAARDQLLQIATARCARVSYLTHDGRRNFDEDIRLHDQLARGGHWSPFEHVAQAIGQSARSGNFIGWKQYRKLFENEHRGRTIEFPVGVNTGYTPFYSKMEQAFREILLASRKISLTREFSKQCDIALETFFPKDYERDSMFSVVEESKP